MNKKDAYNYGKEHGYSVASWVDVPELNDHIDPSIDYVGLGKRVTEDNRWDYMEMLCIASEENSRQYSPFEFLAYEINSIEDDWKSGEYWDEFDRGVNVGINKRIREAKKSYK